MREWELALEDFLSSYRDILLKRENKE